MKKQIKKVYKKDISQKDFLDLQTNPLNDLGPKYFSLKKKEYYEKIKLQTELAMENKKFLIR